MSRIFTDENNFWVEHSAGRNPTVLPGATIIGSVCRESPLVTPNALIKVTLCGLSRSVVYVSNPRGHMVGSHAISQGGKTYSGRFSIIDEAAHTQKIFHGPIHIAAGEAAQKWTFAIEVPTHVSPTNVAHSVPASQSYLPLDAASIATHPLPNSFNVERQVVEYSIKATILSIQQGIRHIEEVIFPINLVTRSAGSPITDLQLSRSHISAKTSSFKLLPNMGEGRLTLSQRLRQFRSSSDVPQLAGRMEIILPRVLQLDHPKLVPIWLRFIPEDVDTSSSVRGVPVKVELQRMRVNIESITEVRSEGFHKARYEDDTTLVLFPPPKRLKVKGGPVYIPYTEECPLLNVGERCGFTVRRLQRAALQQKGVQLYPDFTTYNIKHDHHLTFEMTVGIADNDIKMKLVGPVVILPASSESGTNSPSVASGRSSQAEAATAPPRSESWIQPPPDNDPPPTFAEVQKEDFISKSSQNRVGCSSGS